MWEKINYYNWVNEELEVLSVDLDNENTKNDLYTLMMLTKMNGEWFTYDEAMELNVKYRDEIWPIISAIDYEWMTKKEALNSVDDIENIEDIDKMLIKFLLLYFYKID